MVQELPLLSIIVPVYKVEKYLSACLDSILVQTYTNFELIVIDDGSPDGCADICESYAARDQRVRVIHQQNAGLAAARNRGLDEAKGELIGFVDSDDTISPDMYSVLYEAMSAGKADICVCNYRCVDEMGHPVGEEDLPIKDEVIVGVSVSFLNPSDFRKASCMRMSLLSIIFWCGAIKRLVYQKLFIYT